MVARGVVTLLLALTSGHLVSAQSADGDCPADLVSFEVITGMLL